MKLAQLLVEYIAIPPQFDCEINHLALDSRLVQPHTLFFALSGGTHTASVFIDAAIAQGACAIVSATEEPNQSVTMYHDRVVRIYLPNLIQHIGELAARFFAYPTQKLQVFGVTGTSGKTSCSHFIAQAFSTLNIPCGLMGSLGWGMLHDLTETGFTTVDAINLQAQLAHFAAREIPVVAMEVSSHSIAQERINGTEFAVGIFTNLSHDHLDYHGTMEAYAAVKCKWVLDYPLGYRIINADDQCGQAILAESQHKPHVLAYSMHHQPGLPVREQIYVENFCRKSNGTYGIINTPWGRGELLLPIIGEFNFSNALAVLASLCVYGLKLDVALMAVAGLRSVPGRLQTIKQAGRPLVVVDYAHKPDALGQVLQTLRAYTTNKLWCIFGCGGERDRSKRPLMAQVAEQYADCIIVTHDNPRCEDPLLIIADIVAGFTSNSKWTLELDRASAIAYAIQTATSDDCILIAGKGAENYQQYGTEKLYFNDIEQVQACFEVEN